MSDMVKALKEVRELDGTPAQVDIVNISMSSETIVYGLNEILNDLANDKILISSAGNWPILLLLLKSCIRYEI